MHLMHMCSPHGPVVACFFFTKCISSVAPWVEIPDITTAVITGVVLISVSPKGYLLLANQHSQNKEKGSCGKGANNKQSLGQESKNGYSKHPQQARAFFSEIKTIVGSILGLPNCWKPKNSSCQAWNKHISWKRGTSPDQPNHPNPPRNIYRPSHQSLWTSKAEGLLFRGCSHKVANPELQSTRCVKPINYSCAPHKTVEPFKYIYI